MFYVRPRRRQVHLSPHFGVKEQKYLTACARGNKALESTFPRRLWLSESVEPSLRNREKRYSVSPKNHFVTAAAEDIDDSIKRKRIHLMIMLPSSLDNYSTIHPSFVPRQKQATAIEQETTFAIVSASTKLTNIGNVEPIVDGKSNQSRCARAQFCIDLLQSTVDIRILMLQIVGC